MVKLLIAYFDTKITKDEVMQAHNKKPFIWRGRENIEAFKFLSTSEAEALSMFDKKKEDCTNQENLKICLQAQKKRM